MHIFEAAVL